jgi:hypothetical protein
MLEMKLYKPRSGTKTMTKKIVPSIILEVTTTVVIDNRTIVI